MWAAVRLGALAVSEGARVEAVDFSPAMIELARSFDPEGLASYRVCTLCEILPLPTSRHVEICRTIPAHFPEFDP